MKLSINHLKNFLPKNINNSEISDKLNKLGHENEIIKNIIDIEVTPNRGDCLSLEGILRDLNNFYPIDLNIPLYEKEIQNFVLPFKNNSEGSCNKISFLKIETVGTVKRYKPYLEDFFSELNKKKINFFTDVSNFICYEMGQPTHCYDLDKIDGEIELKWIDNEDKFSTLHGKEINLKNKNLVFLVRDKIINLAGVMGGLETSCSSQTKNVLIESAFFEPHAIIGKSIKYGIDSDAAFRFERGIDILRQEDALRRFIYIVNDHLDIKNLELYIEEKKSFKKKKINLDIQKIKKILGIDIPDESCMNILMNLGFEIDGYVLSVPSYRHDINTHNDLAEEIARVLGYDNIPSLKPDIYDKTNSASMENKLKNYLIKKGFFEIINFPFSSKEAKNSIMVDNPLDSNKSYLRTNLLDSLIENLLYNERRQKESIQLFEISNVYEEQNKQINQKKKISLLVSGRMGNTYENFNKHFNKEFLREILYPILEEEKIEVQELSREKLDTKIKNKIYYAEFNLNEINLDKIEEKNTLQTSFSSFKKVSEFPSTYRDLSVTFKNLDDLEAMTKEILEFKDSILVESFVFDYYPNIEKEIVKIGFRFIFQHSSRTLTENDVGNVLSEIIKLIYDFDGTEIQGFDLTKIIK